jgi:hypothetical protein
VEPLGTRAEVTAKILEAVPTADFSDPAWGRIEGETFSIEVNVGADDLVTSFMLRDLLQCPRPRWLCGVARLP